LELRYTFSSNWFLNNSSGIVPLKEFWYSDTNDNFLRLPNSGGIEPDMLLALKLRFCRYFRCPISGPIEPETPEDDRSREITLFLPLQPTPFHAQGVASEAVQLDLRELGSMRLLDRERRARPSELKPCDDESNDMKNSQNQCQKTSFILFLKFCIEISTRSFYISYIQVGQYINKWGLHICTVVIIKGAHIGNFPPKATFGHKLKKLQVTFVFPIKGGGNSFLAYNLD
jgi:hypothetical protein